MSTDANSIMAQLDDAIFIAVSIHHNQFDKKGNPYILHPLHIMQQFLWNPRLACIAVLHDTIEDSNGTLTIESLMMDWNFNASILDALRLLTRADGQDYMTDYIVGISTNIDAILVKRQDLKHNSDITRQPQVADKDLRRIAKYHKAFLILGQAKRKIQNLE